MKIKHKLLSFAKIVGDEAHEKKEKMEAEASEMLKTQYEQTIATLKKESEEAFELEKRKTDAQKSKRILDVSRESRLKASALRASLTDALFERVSAKVAAYAETDEYVKKLAKDMENVYTLYKPCAVKFYLRRRDLKSCDASKMPNAEFLRADYDIMGGFYADIPEKKLFIDETFSSNIAKEQESFNSLSIG